MTERIPSEDELDETARRIAAKLEALTLSLRWWRTVEGFDKPAAAWRRKWMSKQATSYLIEQSDGTANGVARSRRFLDRDDAHDEAEAWTKAHRLATRVYLIDSNGKRHLDSTCEVIGGGVHRTMEEY